MDLFIGEKTDLPPPINKAMRRKGSLYQRKSPQKQPPPFSQSVEGSGSSAIFFRGGGDGILIGGPFDFVFL